MLSVRMKRITRPSIACLVVCSGLAFVLFSLLGCSSRQPQEPLPTISAWQEPPRSPTLDIPVARTEPDLDGAQLIDVTMADGINSVMVNFKAPPDLVQEWWQGSIYVVDENTGVKYSEIPVMPVIGPLFGKPHEEGQAGYVMLLNYDQRVKNGSVVTVVLGKYKREHIVVGQ